MRMVDFFVLSIFLSSSTIAFSAVPLITWKTGIGFTVAPSQICSSQGKVLATVNYGYPTTFTCIAANNNATTFNINYMPSCPIDYHANFQLQICEPDQTFSNQSFDYALGSQFFIFGFVGIAALYIISHSVGVVLKMVSKH